MPPELVRAIAAHGAQPVRLEDPDTLRVYRLVEEEPVEITLDPDYVEKMLEEGIAAVEAGQVVPWDPERIKQEGRRRLAERRRQN